MEDILNINPISVICSIISPLQKQTWVASVCKEVQQRIVSVWWPFDVRSRCDRPFSWFAITWNQMLPTWKIRNLRRRKSGQLWPHKWCLWVRRNYSHIKALNCIWTTGCYADKNVLVLTTIQLNEKANQVCVLHSFEFLMLFIIQDTKYLLYYSSINSTS